MLSYFNFAIDATKFDINGALLLGLNVAVLKLTDSESTTLLTWLHSYFG